MMTNLRKSLALMFIVSCSFVSLQSQAATWKYGHGTGNFLNSLSLESWGQKYKTEGLVNYGGNLYPISGTLAYVDGGIQGPLTLTIAFNGNSRTWNCKTKVFIRMEWDSSSNLPVVAQLKAPENVSTELRFASFSGGPEFPLCGEIWGADFDSSNPSRCPLLSYTP